MNIQSINISAGNLITYKDKQVPTGIGKKPVFDPVYVSEYGIEGDTIVDTTVHGGLDQAIYIYFQEDYEWWASELAHPETRSLYEKLGPGIFGENLTIAGLRTPKERDLTLGDVLVIGDVELEISAPRAPCFKLAATMDSDVFIKHFIEAVRPGAYGRVLKTGKIQVGDAVALRKTDKDHATINEVFIEWHRADKSKAALKKALDSPLATVHRARFEEIYSGMA